MFEQNGIRMGVYPASPSSWLFIVIAIMGSIYARVDPSMGMINSIKKVLPARFVCQHYNSVMSYGNDQIRQKLYQCKSPFVPKQHETNLIKIKYTFHSYTMIRVEELYGVTILDTWILSKKDLYKSVWGFFSGFLVSLLKYFNLYYDTCNFSCYTFKK